jgi:hypothetical protein
MTEIVTTPCNTSRSLLLLDPCDYLNNAQDIDCGMMIVFSSPSCLVGQPNKPNLSTLDKNSIFYVMSAPTLEERCKIHDHIDEDQLRRFLWDKEGKVFCSLQWFSYSEEQVPAHR